MTAVSNYTDSPSTTHEAEVGITVEKKKQTPAAVACWDRHAAYLNTLSVIKFHYSL